MNYFETRKEIYSYHKKNYQYVFEWPWYSYRRYKILYYIEGASLVATVLLKMRINPNVVTIAYMISVITAGILFALPMKAAVLTASLIMITAPLLDSVDGTLARVQNMASLDGYVLDRYASLVSWICLWTGIGLYLGNYSNKIFYYLAPIIPALFAMNIHICAREIFVHQGFIKKEPEAGKKNSMAGCESDTDKKTSIRSVKDFIDKIFEHNARTVDLLCFFVIVELFTSLKIVWLFYSAFLVWQVVIYFMRIFMVAFKGWGEGELENIRRKLF